MKEHPILFSGEMVRAIIEGRKTQTRRVLKPQPKETDRGSHRPLEWKEFSWFDGGSRPDLESRCPYGKPGDRLWVRETFTTAGGNQILYYSTDDVNGLRKKKPAIHMPRSYSRISLDIVKVKVERVQQISEGDALAEGVSPYSMTQQEIDDLQISDCSPCEKELARLMGPGQFSAKFTYEMLWEELNLKRGFGWSVNPWVWAIEFRRVA